MVKRFHHASVSVFSKTNVDFLNAFLPVPVSEFLSEQFSYDPDHDHTKVYALPKNKSRLSLQEGGGFDGDLSIYKFYFEKQTDTNKMFDKVVGELSPDDRALLSEERFEHTDAHGRFMIRLSQDALEQGRFELSKGGACVQLSFLLAAYPKNEKTIKRCVEELL